jgi:hypothetical protein
MSKNINFRARSKTEFEVQDKPYPAVKKLPKWYMDESPLMFIQKDHPNDGKLHLRGRRANITFKKCIPLLDGMSAGYILPLWADVLVEQENGIPSIYWKTINNVFEIHGSDTMRIVPPVGYQNVVYKYLNCWIPQTPPGYSCLITSPLGHHDLPFKAVPAIVDTDKSTLEVLFPVWIKEGLEGVVERGTPIAQIIPFKRDNWESTFDYYEDGQYYGEIEEKNANKTIVGHYLKNHWSKKKFK